MKLNLMFTLCSIALLNSCLIEINSKYHSLSESEKQKLQIESLNDLKNTPLRKNKVHLIKFDLLGSIISSHETMTLFINKFTCNSAKECVQKYSNLKKNSFLLILDDLAYSNDILNHDIYKDCYKISLRTEDRTNKKVLDLLDDIEEHFHWKKKSKYDDLEFMRIENGEIVEMTNSPNI